MRTAILYGYSKPVDFLSKYSVLLVMAIFLHCRLKRQFPQGPLVEMTHETFSSSTLLPVVPWGHFQVLFGLYCILEQEAHDWFQIQISSHHGIISCHQDSQFNELRVKMQIREIILQDYSEHTSMNIYTL